MPELMAGVAESVRKGGFIVQGTILCSTRIPSLPQNFCLTNTGQQCHLLPVPIYYSRGSVLHASMSGTLPEPPGSLVPDVQFAMQVIFIREETMQWQ